MWQSDMRQVMKRRAFVEVQIQEIGADRPFRFAGFTARETFKRSDVAADFEGDLR